MKRTNLKTGKSFKRGETREDGLIFFAYAARLNDAGFNVEIWVTQEQLEFKKKCLRGYQKRSQLGFVGRAIKMLHAAKSRALKHGGNVTITKEWIREKLATGVCELTGLPFDFSPSKTSYRNPYAPSLDRIDNTNRNYTPDNTRVILAAANVALADHKTEDVLPILKSLVFALENK